MALTNAELTLALNALATITGLLHDMASCPTRPFKTAELVAWDASVNALNHLRETGQLPGDVLK